MKPSGRKGPGRDSTSSKAIATAERHAEWLDRRKQGWTYRRIAAHYKVQDSTVQEAVAKMLQAIRVEPAIELRAFELEALDDLIDQALRDVEEGADRIELIRKLRADRRKMLGLDAPQKLEITAPPREQMWETIRGWLTQPTPELEQVLHECGWHKVVETKGEER